MKNRRILSTIIILLVGSIIGVIIISLLALIANYVSPGVSLTNYPRTFGSIKVWVQEYQEGKLPEGIELPEGFREDCAKMLWMTKDDVPFLAITQNQDGKITGLYLVKKNYRPVFWMEPSTFPGEWGDAFYSDVRLTDTPAGDVYRDFNFDGKFDFKLTLTGDANRPSRLVYICMDGSWQKVDHFRYDVNETKASIGEIGYIFDPNFGWQQKQ